MSLAVNDLVFKYIFGAEERKPLLLEFLNLVMERAGLPKAASITIRNPFVLPLHEDAKSSVLDIEAEDESRRAFDVEVQLSDKASYKDRAVYYLAHLFSDQLFKGEDYSLLRPAIGIHILNFALSPRRRHFFKLFRYRDCLDPDPASSIVLTEKETVIALEIPFLPASEHCGRLEKLLHLLMCEGGNQAMVEELTQQEEFFAEIDAAYKRFHENPDLRAAYMSRMKWRLDRGTEMASARREGLAEGHAEGHAKGVAEGTRERVIADARNFKRLGVSATIIAEATGLDVKEIEGL